nr:hypothetical protein [Tanacetum cinerariifolium]
MEKDEHSDEDVDSMMTRMTRMVTSQQVVVVSAFFNGWGLLLAMLVTRHALYMISLSLRPRISSNNPISQARCCDSVAVNGSAKCHTSPVGHQRSTCNYGLRRCSM